MLPRYGHGYRAFWLISGDAADEAADIILSSDS